MGRHGSCIIKWVPIINVVTQDVSNLLSVVFKFYARVPMKNS